MENTNTSSGKFMLRLTDEERRKIKIIAIQRGTTMQNLIREFITTKENINNK